MKNKGFTLVEIIVSIALISIIMIFLIKLLIQVNYERVNELYDSANAINRSEILKTVENDLHNKLKTISITKGTSNLVIDFTTKDGSKSSLTFYIENDTYYVLYKKVNKNMKWELKTNNTNTYIYLNNYGVKEIHPQNGNTNIYSAVTISIPVIIDNTKKSSSVLDDFVFSFYSHDTRITVVK